ncbi:MAG TPA: hypothetical protein VKZ53_06220 [Candidatus Angelobacter sp.]|nr:hypothetical protein [Candidatus Angelobacter sp.]
MRCHLPRSLDSNPSRHSNGCRRSNPAKSGQGEKRSLRQCTYDLNLRDFGLAQEYDFPAMAAGGEMLKKSLTLCPRQALLDKGSQFIGFRVHLGKGAGAQPLPQQIGESLHF